MRVHLQIGQSVADTARSTCLFSLLRPRCLTRLLLANLFLGPLTGVAPAPARAMWVGAPGDTLRGRVEDASGMPLRGVEITIIEIGRRTATDDRGVFVLLDVPPGRYSVLARAAGFDPELTSVAIPRPAGLTIRLSALSFELPPVTVTAVRNPVDPKLAALPTDELGPEQLRREHGVSLAHALDDLAGVTTLSTGEQVGKPVIRGLTGSRVLVLTDALRLEDYSWSDEDGPSVDVRLADRVEVIRGPASLLYGSDALGGVVNVIPAPLPDGVGRSAYADGRVEAYGASNNHEAGGVLRLEGGAGGFGWRVMGVGRFADDYRTPDGPVENTGFGSFSGEAATGLRGAWGSASLRLTHFGGEFKLLEADAPAGGVEGTLDKGPERKAADDRVQLSATIPAGERVRLEGKAQWQRHSLIELGDTPGGTPGQETTQFDLLLSTLTADVMAHHELGSGVAGTVGVSGTAQSNDSRGPQPIVPDGRVSSAALFLFEQVPAGPLRLSIGGRIDARRLEVDPDPVLGNPADTRTYTVASAGIGGAYGIGDILLRANVGRAWRAPTLFELYSNGPRIGEALYEVGRPDLTPESSLDLDLGVEYSSPILRLAVSAYRNRINDFIFLAPTDSFVDSLRVYAHDQAPAVLWGGEIAVDLRPTSTLTLHGRADYVHGTNTATDEPLPLMAPPSGAVRAELAGGRVGWLGRSYVSVEAEGFAKQTRLSSFDYQTDGYVLVHLAAGMTPHVGWEALQLDIQLRNLFNTAYRSYLSRYKEFAFNPGRSLLLRVGVSF